MLVIHSRPDPEQTTGDDNAPTRSAAHELERLRQMAIETPDRTEREALLAEIRERFGDGAVNGTIARLRAGSENET
jgi:hypothetical protein